MAIQIISIGSELLTGEILNTNFQFLAGRLSDNGYDVDREVCIHDTPAAVAAAVTAALADARLVLTIGGLGPTQDDLTRQTIAEVLDMPLAMDRNVAAVIQAKYRSYKRNIPDSSWQIQSMVPRGAVVLPNDWGTAPGLWCERDGRAVVMLPGPPRELQPMFETYVLPRLHEFVQPTVAHRLISVFGLGESNTEKRVHEILPQHDGITLAYCAKPDRCHVRLSAKLANVERLDETCAALLAALGDDGGPAQENLATRICDIIRRRGWLWGTAESCTGGGIAQNVTDNPGVSDVFAGGVVTYSNAMKVQLLGVDEDVLQAHGAVSEPVARQMVEGLLERYGLQAGVAVTGIAGPAGGSAEKPVGTVHIAAAVQGDVHHLQRVFPHGRRGMRERTIVTALNLLHDQLRRR